MVPYECVAFATLAIQQGVDAKTVSSMLGHYSAGFTLDTYTHVTTQMQQAAADKMGGFMEAALPGEGTPDPEPPREGGGKVIPFERLRARQKILCKRSQAVVKRTRTSEE